MASPSAAVPALPPLDKQNLISIWLGTLCYGINVVVYFGVVYVLAFKRRNGVSSHKHLLAMSTFLFLCSTIQEGLGLQQLLDAFIGPAVTIPSGASLYFADQTNRLSFVKQFLYCWNVFAQDLIVIWRAYVVWGSDWRFAIVPLIAEFVHTAASLHAVISFFKGTDIEDKVVRAWALVGWCLDLVINIGGTSAIVIKLWWAGRKTLSLRRGKGNAYMGIVYVVLESGAMFSAATLVLVILYLNNPTALDALAGINVVTQLATLSPLLIIVRIGLGITHGNVAATSMYDQNTEYLSAPRFVSGGTSTTAQTVHIEVGRDVHRIDDSYAMASIKQDQDDSSMKGQHVV